MERYYSDGYVYSFAVSVDFLHCDNSETNYHHKQIKAIDCHWLPHTLVPGPMHSQGRIQNLRKRGSYIVLLVHEKRGGLV